MRVICVEKKKVTQKRGNIQVVMHVPCRRRKVQTGKRMTEGNPLKICMGPKHKR